MKIFTEPTMETIEFSTDVIVSSTGCGAVEMNNCEKCYCGMVGCTAPENGYTPGVVCGTFWG